jgi:hypothetical protein
VAIQTCDAVGLRHCAGIALSAVTGLHTDQADRRTMATAADRARGPAIPELREREVARHRIADHDVPGGLELCRRQ